MVNSKRWPLTGLNPAEISHYRADARFPFKRWEQLLPKERKDPDLSVMGMVVRGTDLASAYHQTIDIESTIIKAEYVFYQKGYVYLFLAMEESLYLQ